MRRAVGRRAQARIEGQGPGCLKDECVFVAFSVLAGGHAGRFQSSLFVRGMSGCVGGRREHGQGRGAGETRSLIWSLIWRYGITDHGPDRAP